MITQTCYVRVKNWNVTVEYTSFWAPLHAIPTLVHTWSIWMSWTRMKMFVTDFTWNVLFCHFSFKSELCYQQNDQLLDDCLLIGSLYKTWIGEGDIWGHFSPQDIWTTFRVGVFLPLLGIGNLAGFRDPNSSPVGPCGQWSSCGQWGHCGQWAPWWLVGSWWSVGPLQSVGLWMEVTPGTWLPCQVYNNC